LDYFLLEKSFPVKDRFFSKSGGVFISVQSEIEPSFPNRPVLAQTVSKRINIFSSLAKLPR